MLNSSRRPLTLLLAAASLLLSGCCSCDGSKNTEEPLNVEGRKTSSAAADLDKDAE